MVVRNREVVGGQKKCNVIGQLLDGEMGKRISSMEEVMRKRQAGVKISY